MMRSTNPAMRVSSLSNIQHAELVQTATVQGAVNRALILLFLIIVGAYWSWSKIMQPVSQAFDSVQMVVPKSVYLVVGISAIAGFIFALVTIFKKEWSPTTAPIYALCEGVFLGGISSFMEFQYPGIVVQAISLTFGTLLALLLVYKSGWIKVTDKFRIGILAATGGIALVYMLSWILSFFGRGLPMVYAATPFGIGFSVFVVIIAALNLILDFDFIEKVEDYRLPRYMEWYSAFGLMLTLVWLYVEILRLLAKLRSRR